jgi:hypothetical protein
MVNVKTAFTVLLGVSVFGTAACGDDNGGEVRTVTVNAPAATEEVLSGIGDAILIETRIPDPRTHAGEVLDGSVIGESAFCPGGKTRGGSTGGMITATFRCPGGRLTVSYSPTQRSLVQSSEWKVVSATGNLKGLDGGGWMVANFGSDNPEQGGETFTGTVTH